MQGKIKCEFNFGFSFKIFLLNTVYKMMMYKASNVNADIHSM